jgi:hypothetical protein
MSKRRYLIRSENASQLSGSEQEQFVDDVYSIVDGEDVRGTFIVSGGWNWLDWEADASTAERVVDEFKNLDDVGAVELEQYEDAQNWTLDDGWYGHGDNDAHRQC